MGTYLDTATSLSTRAIGVTFDTLTTALAVEMVTDAENEINKYISKRYDISGFTLTSAPPLLTSLTKKLALGYLYQNNSRGGIDAWDRGQKLIDQVIANLELLRDYKVDLIDSSGSVIADMSNTSYRVMCNTSDYAPTFNEDAEINWKVDSNKLDDIDSERD